MKYFIFCQEKSGVSRYRALVLSPKERPVVKVFKMVGSRGLKITFFERFAVPNSVTFVYRYVVHVNWNPNVARGICDFVIDIIADDKISRFCIAVLNIINARSLTSWEVFFCPTDHDNGFRRKEKLLFIAYKLRNHSGRFV